MTVSLHRKNVINKAKNNSLSKTSELFLRDNELGLELSTRSA